jgi:glycosidase
MISLRSSSAALRRGSVEWLSNSDASRVVTYRRRSPDEEVLVAINFSNRPFSGSIEMTAEKGFADVTPDVAPPLPPDAPATAQASRSRVVTLPALSLEAWGYRIFRRSVK